MTTASPTYVIGDIHGQYEKLLRVLQQAALIDEQGGWCAGSAALWFIGDLVDRGPDSIAVLDFVMRLQREAATAGGEVGCLLGNHELLLLGAYRFGKSSSGLNGSFIARWRRNGGKRSDLRKLHRQHLDWLANLPAIVRLERTLLIHADAILYTRYGHSIEEVNSTFQQMLSKNNTLAWEELLNSFALRGVFHHEFGGNKQVQYFLELFCVEQIVHGHTPISAITHRAASEVTEPLIYAQGRCINVDGGLYLGGSGFLYQLTQRSQQPLTK